MRTCVRSAAALRMVAENCSMTCCIREKNEPRRTQRTRRKGKSKKISSGKNLSLAHDPLRRKLAAQVSKELTRLYSRFAFPRFCFSSLSSVFQGSVLETRQVGELLLAAMHVHGAELGAALQRGHGLAGIEQ